MSRDPCATVGRGRRVDRRRPPTRRQVDLTAWPGIAIVGFRGDHVETTQLAGTVVVLAGALLTRRRQRTIRPEAAPDQDARTA